MWLFSWKRALTASAAVTVCAVAALSASGVGGQIRPPISDKAVELKTGALATKVTILTDAQKLAKYRLALANNLLTLGSKKYAKLKSFDAGTCDPGEMMTVDYQARIIAGRDAKLQASCNDNVQAIYSPPDQNWAIQSYVRNFNANSSKNVSSDGVTPGNYTFNNSSAYSSVESSLNSFVAGLDIPGVIKADLNAQISSQLSNYASYANSVSSSAATIKHDAKVCVPGMRAGGGSYDGWLTVKLKCVPKAVRSQAALETQLKAWVVAVTSGL